MAMSLAEDRTKMLWKNFMPGRNLISNKVSDDLFSVRVYGGDFDANIDNPSLYFKKWAAVEVKDLDNVPEGMGTIILEKGLYAVFHYTGPSTDPSIYEYIFTEWLPNSAYKIDNRPFFEVMGEKYKNNDPDSEEDIYIPVSLKD